MRLFIDFADEPIFLEEPKDVDEDSGKKVTLKCSVESNPKPEIVWTQENSLKVERIETWFKGFLKLNINQTGDWTRS